MSQTASWNEGADSLWRRAANNFFEIAQAQGYAVALEPNALDSAINSMRKSTDYTAFFAENP